MTGNTGIIAWKQTRECLCQRAAVRLVTDPKGGNLRRVGKQTAPGEGKVGGLEGRSLRLVAVADVCGGSPAGESSVVVVGGRVMGLAEEAALG